MKEGQKLWTREELILAINLYYKTPFGKLHNRNPEVIHLANLINRTANSLAYKLVNLASLDPTLKERGVKGAVNASKLDKEIWNEFYTHRDLIPFESEKLLAKLENKTIESLNDISEFDFGEGLTREQLVRIRVNQSFFRKTILASYNNTCAVTGLQQPGLLVASHINKWSSDEKNRLNPQNGILLNPLHDKAFENGFITITPDYKILISSILKKKAKENSVQDYFLKYEGQGIILPTRFLPDPEFLKKHNEERFRR